jgi:5-methylcytosine-specific restriction endonuclease McrA
MPLVDEVEGGLVSMETNAFAPRRPDRRTVEYEAYIHSAKWERRREWALRFWGYRCAICFSANNLEVHHRTYERLGDEIITDLIVLCDDCHKTHHATINRTNGGESITGPLSRLSAKQAERM